jgi:hypothetical protein
VPSSWHLGSQTGPLPKRGPCYAFPDVHVANGSTERGAVVLPPGQSTKPFSSLLPLFLDPSKYPRFYQLSRKLATIFSKGTIPEPSASHIGKGVALIARAAAFVYIYVRIPQIAKITLSFYAKPIITIFSGLVCCLNLSRLLRIL